MKHVARTLLLAVLVLSAGALGYRQLASRRAVTGPTVVDTTAAVSTVAASVTGVADLQPEETATADTDHGTAAPVPATTATSKTEPAAPRILHAVYYHGNFRCQTCNSIEDQAGRAINTVFAADVAKGALDWSTCNIDKAGNEHFETDFQLTSASLVLTDGKGAKGRWKVLEKTWELVSDTTAFRDYVTQETRAFLAAGR